MSPTPPDRGAVLERYRTAVVRVEVTGRDPEGRVALPRLGTGVVVGANGLILTAGHVVGRDEDWDETSPGSGLRARTVKVTGLDADGAERTLGEASVEPIPGQDLALLLVRPRTPREVPLAEQAPADIESVVALLWEPGGVPEAVTADLAPTDRARFGGRLTVRLGVVVGNSGSGLFDAQLRLVGVVVSRIDAQRALAVPAAWVKSIVDARRLPSWPPPQGEGTMDRAEVLLAALRARAALGAAPRMAAAEVEALAGGMGIAPTELPGLAAQLAARQPPVVALVWGGGLEVVPPAAAAGAGSNITYNINMPNSSFDHGTAISVGGSAQGGYVTTAADANAAIGALGAVVAQLAALRPSLQGEAAQAAGQAEQALRGRPAPDAPAEEKRGWAEQAGGFLAKLLKVAPQAKALVEMGEKAIRLLV